MDKQKQIQHEELIGIVQGAVGGCATHWASLIAEEVLKYYQPKIPEGAVVLTREEYDELTLTKQSIFELLEDREDETRKETAEKFAERLKADIASHRTEMYLNGLKGTPRTNELTYECVEEYIDEICKEITGKEVQNGG